MEKLIPNERVDQVMSELNQALDRERKTQTLLAEQGSQIKQLSRKIEIESSDREHSEQSVIFTVKVDILKWYIYTIPYVVQYLLFSWEVKCARIRKKKHGAWNCIIISNIFWSYVHLQQLEDELDSKATAITNLTRQVSTLESERRQLHENIYDAETALKTAAQDRHTLSNYVETLTSTFNKVCHDRGHSINGRRVGAFPTTLHADMFF